MASEYVTDVITPEVLTGFVRGLLNSGGMPYAGLFPPLATDDIDYELTNADVSAAGEVARYREWNAPTPIGTRPGITIIGGEILPLSWGYFLGEDDLQRFDNLRSGLGARADQRVVDVIIGDARRAADAIQNRLTLAHGELLTTGVVTLTELGNATSGNRLVANFGVPGDQLNVAPGTGLWSDHALSTPITDFKTWEATLRARNGGANPLAWMVSSEVMADLALNAQVRGNLANIIGASPTIVGEDLVRQVLRVAGVNARIEVANDVERPTLTSGTPARVIGTRKVVGVYPNTGSTLYGMTSHARQMVADGRIELTDAPGIVAFSVRDVFPAPWLKTEAHAVSVPVIRDPKALFVASV